MILTHRPDTTTITVRRNIPPIQDSSISKADLSGMDLVQLLVTKAIPIAFIGQLQDDSNRVPENINRAHMSIFAAFDPADYVGGFSAELRGSCPAHNQGI